MRLKSPHDRVSLATMLPEPGDLELILQLEAAIRRKIVAARPYGMEIEVVESDVAEEIKSYARRLSQGDESLLDEADESPESRAVNGELLRAELRRAAAEGEIDRVRNLPWGVGAAFAQGSGVPSVGPPGVFLACRTRDGDRYWRYVADSGDMASAPATILRRIDPGDAPGVPSPPVDLESAWSAGSSLGHRRAQRSGLFVGRQPLARADPAVGPRAAGGRERVVLRRPQPTPTKPSVPNAAASSAETCPPSSAT